MQPRRERPALFDDFAIASALLACGSRADQLESSDDVASIAAV